MMKYEIIKNKNSKVIRALRDIPMHGIKKGDLGPIFSNSDTNTDIENFLSQEGECWVTNKIFITIEPGFQISGDILIDCINGEATLGKCNIKNCSGSIILMKSELYAINFHEFNAEDSELDIKYVKNLNTANIRKNSKVFIHGKSDIYPTPRIFNLVIKNSSNIHIHGTFDISNSTFDNTNTEIRNDTKDATWINKIHFYGNNLIDITSTIINLNDNTFKDSTFIISNSRNVSLDDIVNCDINLKNMKMFKTQSPITNSTISATGGIISNFAITNSKLITKKNLTLAENSMIKNTVIRSKENVDVWNSKIWDSEFVDNKKFIRIRNSFIINSYISGVEKPLSIALSTLVNGDKTDLEFGIDAPTGETFSVLTNEINISGHDSAESYVKEKYPDGILVNNTKLSRLVNAFSLGEKKSTVGLSIHELVSKYKYTPALHEGIYNMLDGEGFALLKKPGV